MRPSYFSSGIHERTFTPPVIGLAGTMERFDISAEFRRRVTSRGENQNGYDISSGKAEGRVFHAINLTLHFSLVLLHHFATFKSPPSLSLVFLLFQRLLHSFQLVSLRATPYYLSYVNEFRLII